MTKNGLWFVLEISLFLSFFLAVLGLCCCVGFSVVAERRGYCLVPMRGLLIAVLLLLWSAGSRVHGLQ